MWSTKMNNLIGENLKALRKENCASIYQTLGLSCTGALFRVINLLKGDKYALKPLAYCLADW